MGEQEGSTKMSSSVAAGSAYSASPDVASLIEKAIAAQEYGVLDIPTNQKYNLDARFLLYKYIVYSICTLHICPGIYRTTI